VKRSVKKARVPVNPAAERTSRQQICAPPPDERARSLCIGDNNNINHLNCDFAARIKVATWASWNCSIRIEHDRKPPSRKAGPGRCG
jgi:hypothetical protein